VGVLISFGRRPRNVVNSGNDLGRVNANISVEI
jgi:hypothetical protein